MLCGKLAAATGWEISFLPSWTFPSTKEPSSPLEPRPTVRLLDVRQLIEAGPVIALMKARAQSFLKALLGFSVEQLQPDKDVNAEHDNESSERDAPLTGRQSDIHQRRSMIQC